MYTLFSILKLFQMFTYLNLLAKKIGGAVLHLTLTTACGYNYCTEMFGKETVTHIQRHKNILNIPLKFIGTRPRLFKNTRHLYKFCKLLYRDVASISSDLCALTPTWDKTHRFPQRLAFCALHSLPNLETVAACLIQTCC